MLRYSSFVLARKIYSTIPAAASLLRAPSSRVPRDRHLLLFSTATTEQKRVPGKGSSLQGVSNALDGSKTEKEVEKFIPLTRRALLRMLMEDERLLRSDDKRLMEKVAAALDAKYSKRFYSILEQAKVREAAVGVVCTRCGL